MSMSDDQYDDLDDDQPDDSSVIKGYRKTAREQAKQITALQEQLETASKYEAKVNLYDANLGDLTPAQQDAVFKTAGAMTADALRSQAELLGFVQPPAPAMPEQDLAAYDRVAEAQAGGQTLDAASYEAEIGGARSESEVLAVMAKYGKQTRQYD